tara:strand:+ start:1850 stop:2449 length:600 start_codon:yes stop_codon:yes gene_type:complete
MPSINIEQEIKKFFSEDFECLLIICPFISLKGLKKIFSFIKKKEVKKIDIVTRWRKLDIISGVSDIEVYTYLKKYNINLFHHNSIHMKIFIKNKKEFLFGSANITEAGLGISKHPNEEVIGFENLEEKFYKKFENILKKSLIIDDKYYSEMKKLKEENKLITEEIINIKNDDIKLSEIWKFLTNANALDKDKFIKKYFT